MGEILSDLGEFCLTSKLDPDDAKKYLDQGLSWCTKLPEIEQTLTFYDLPGQASQVASPPAESVRADKWGNVIYAEQDMKPGQIVSHRTANWYLGLLHSRLLRHIGFLHFVNGELDQARACFAKMGEVDARLQWLIGNSMPNFNKRLQVRCEDGAFRRHRLEDLKCLEDKRRRFVFFLADFYAETEEPARAAEMYQALLAGEFGRLKDDEEALYRFSLGWVLWYDGVFNNVKKKQEASMVQMEMLYKEQRFRHAPILPRALIAYGNMIRMMDGDCPEAARDVYRFVARNYPKNSFAEDALYILGEECVRRQKGKLKQEGEQALRDLLKKYPDSQYTVLAQEALAKYVEK